MMADELLNAQDLITAKKHDTFHSEVVTGKAGGLSTGANIDYATNAVTGQVQKTLPATVNGIDWSYVGKFADGVTFTKSTDFAIDANGTQWIYTGNYPFSATAGTVPSEPTYQAVHVRDHNSLSDRNAAGAHDAIYNRQFSTLDSALNAYGLTDGIAVEVKERSIGNSGGGVWDVVLTSTVTPNGYNIVVCTGVPSLSLVLRIGGILDVAQFGAKAGDLTFNSSPAIQAAIEYCAPFPWLGSVGATRANGRSVAKLYSRGVFRVDSPININPFLDWDAGGGVGFFYARPSQQTQTEAVSVGTMLYPFFTNKEQWVVDTNPYNTSGVRAVPAKATIGNPQFDDLEYTLMHGIKIEGLAIVDDTGSGILGGLRLLGAPEHQMKNILCDRFMYPYMEMCCWGHTRERIHTTGYHAGFTTINGTVGTDVGGCYFTGAANYPPSISTVGDWWDKGDPASPLLNPTNKIYLRTGVYARGADTFPIHTMTSPTTEGFERVYMAIGCSLKIIKPYIEANTVVVCHGWNANVEFDTPFLFNPDGGGVGADDLPFFYVSNGWWKVTKPIGSKLGKAMEYTNNFAEIHIEYAPNTWIKDYPLSTYRDGADFEFRPAIDFNGIWNVGSFDVFVANGGRNNNYGLSPEYPLANGERMLTRVIAGSSLNLIYKDDQSHGVSGTGTSNKDLKVNIKRSGDGAVRPIIFKALNFGDVYGAFGLDNSSIDVEDVDINIISAGAIDPTYAGMFRLTGTCAINIFNSAIAIQNGKSLLNPFFNKSAIVTMTVDRSTITGYDDGGGITYGALSANNFGNAGRLTVIDDAQGTTMNALIGGYATNTTKISSRLKP